MEALADAVERTPTRKPRPRGQPLSLEPGQDLLHYRLVETLGAGGMGVVYRAHDSKLRRDVAIKVLPDNFAADPERLTRFEREAHVLASLNHAGIASIYGLEEASGTRFLVLELVEGETLASVSTDPVVSIGRPRVVHELEDVRDIALAPNGDFLLLQRVPGSGIQTRVHLVQNWFQELERLVP